MGLPWVRIDTQFASNPKVLELVADKQWRSAFVYVAAICYSGAHGTGGFLPATCLPFIHATKTDVENLIKVGLLIDDMGGWDINGWAEFQVMDEAAEKRSDKARKAAQARWLKGQRA